MNKKLLFLLFVFSFFQLEAQTTFTGAVNNDWFTAGNWTNGVPANGNDATIPSGLEVEVQMNLMIDYALMNDGIITALNIDRIEIKREGLVENEGTIRTFGSIISKLYNLGQIINKGMIEEFELFNFAIGTVNNSGTFTSINSDNDGIINNTGVFSESVSFTSFGEFRNNGNMMVELKFVNRGNFFNNNILLLRSSSTNGIGGWFVNTGTVTVPRSNFQNIGVFENSGEGAFQSGTDNYGIMINSGSLDFSDLSNNNNGNIENNGELIVFGLIENYARWTNNGKLEQREIYGGFTNTGTYVNTDTTILSGGLGFNNTGNVTTSGVFNVFNTNAINQKNILNEAGGEMDLKGLAQSDRAVLTNRGLVYNREDFFNLNLGIIDNQPCATYIYDALLPLNGTVINNSVFYQINTGIVNVTSGNGVVLTDLILNSPAIAICQDITLDVIGATTINLTPDDIDGGSCNYVSRSVSPAVLSCDMPNPQMVTLTVMDGQGNSSMCTAMVTLNCADCIVPDISTTTNLGLCPRESFDLSTLNILDANNTGAIISYHSASPANPSNEIDCSGNILFQKEFSTNINGHEDIPKGVALDELGNIYVTGGFLGAARVYDNAGNLLRTIGTIRTGEYVALDTAGNIYITYREFNFIRVFDNAGNLLRQFGGSGSGNGEFNEPRGIALDDRGNIYVADRDNDRIQVFDNAGNYLRQFGSIGIGDGELSSPCDLTLDAARNIYITDRNNSRVQVFDNMGNHLRHIGGFGFGNGQFINPLGVAVDCDGNTYVSDELHSFVQVFDNNGVYLTQFGIPGQGAGEMKRPFGFTFDDYGNIYVTDGDNLRIQVYSLGNCTVCPTRTRTYHILATNTEDCTDEIAVTIRIGTFSAPAELCVGAGIQMGLGGGLPVGGTYSGPGVIDDGNGTSYSFDPSLAGVGIHTLTYTYTGANGECQLTDEVEVISPAVTLSSPQYMCLDAETQGIAFSGGLPTGGMYSGPGVSDNANGLDYAFDPATAGAGSHTISYTFTDAEGCTGVATDTINVYNCSFDISDPCACLDNASPIDLDAGTGGDDGNFSEIISVNDQAGGMLPAGQIWTVTAASGAYNAYSVPPVGVQITEGPFATNGTLTLTHNPALGTYVIPFVHIDAQGYSVTVEGPFALGDPLNTSYSISNNCAYPNPLFDPELLNTYCPNNNTPITLGGIDTDGIGADTITFTIDGIPATRLNPSLLSRGMHTIIMTYDGAAGGTTPEFPGCIQEVVKNITVDDTRAPRAICQDITVALDANGQAFITAAQLDGGSTDNCSTNLSFSASQTSFTCDNIGAVEVDVTVSDEFGNSTNCSATVTVEDNLAPLLNCPSTQTITLDPGDCEYIFDFAITATDNCTADPEITQIVGPPSGTALEKNTTTTYTFEAVDLQGNRSSCSFDITINEFPNPITTLACNGGVQISLDEDCEAEVGADVLLEGGPYGCYDDYIVELFYDDALTQALLSSPAVGASEIGLTLWAMVTDPQTGNSCWGTISVEDKFIPALECEPVIALCSDDLSPEALGFPLPNTAAITSNADGSYIINRFDACGEATLTFTDDIQDFQCQSTHKIINRLWTIVDLSGNTTSCIQVISITRATLNDVQFPLNYDNTQEEALDCSNRCDPDDTRFCGDANLYWNVLPAGHPYAGNPSPYDELWGCGIVKCQGTGLPTGADCGDIHATFEDTRINLCTQGNSESCYKVLRKWSLVDWCTGEVLFHNQVIKIEDNRPPAINDIFNVTISSDIWRCEADWYATEAWLEDNCSSENLSYYIESSTGTVVQENGRWKVEGLPVGRHTVSYIAADCCGNVAQRSISVTVIDDVPPVAVCERHTTVSLSTTQNNGTTGLGIVRVPAATFDDGSYDNCGAVSFQARKVNFGCGNTFFLPYVEFCCSDVGRRVMIELLVRDEARNINTCMVEVEVQDKQAPTLVAPPDLTITCDYWFPFNPDRPNESTPILDERFGKIIDLNGEFDQDSIIVKDRVCEAHPRFADYAPASLFDDPCYDDQYNIFWGYDGYGIDNCGFELEQTVIPNLHCGRGSILRRWRATDPYNNWSNTVTQRITIIDCKAWYVPTACWRFTPRDVSECDLINEPNVGLRYRIKLIEWPCDVEMTTCLEEDQGFGPFAPENLEVNFEQDRRPRFDDDNCSLLAATYTDEAFPFVDGACTKILRTWKVIDWCLYEDFQNGVYAGEWSWEWLQVIKLLNTIAPEFDEGCEDLSFCGYGDPDNPQGNQCVGLIELRPQISDDCTIEEQIKIDYKIDLENNGVYDLLGYSNNYGNIYPFPNPNFLPVTTFLAEEANADGIYPIGTHRILWVGEDGCGNSSSCQQLFTIEDCKPPTAYCEVGVSTIPMPPFDPNDPTTGFVDIWASDFDLGSYDNCTAQSDLNFSFSTDPTDRSRRLTCADAGSNLSYTVYVWDEAGNYASCIVGVVLNDCSGNGFNITGAIRTEEGVELEQVEIELGGAMNDMEMTSIQGIFDFLNLPADQNYTITPAKDINPLNGVTTFDLVLMSKHILGIQSLNSPYKLIAADVNKSGSITTFDMLELRKLILYIDTEFSNNTSWRFVEEGFTFSDPQNPFLSLFPESYAVNGIDRDVLANFVAVKIGDVNCSAATNQFSDSEERKAGKPLQFTIDEQQLEAGKEYVVPFKVENFENMEGYQFTLAVDRERLEFVGFEKGELSDLTSANFGSKLLARGALTSSWSSAEAISLSDGETAFQLIFRAKKTTSLSKALQVSSDYTSAEAYRLKGQNELERTAVTLVFTTPSAPFAQPELLQNQPNPFGTQTTIGFQFPQATYAVLSVYDVNGNLLKKVAQEFTAGYHTITLDGSELKGTGVLLYSLETANFKSERKMIFAGQQ